MEPQPHNDQPSAAGFAAFFGFIPPQKRHFDGSGDGGIKVKYASVKLPVTPSQTAPVANTDASRAAASA